MHPVRIALHVGFLVAAVSLLFASPRPAMAHGGSIDAYGGHNVNRNGNYHAHQGTCAGRTFNSKADAIRAGGKRWLFER